MPDTLSSEINDNTKNTKYSCESAKEAKCAVVANFGVQGDSAIAESKTDDTTHGADHDKTRCTARGVGI